MTEWIRNSLIHIDSKENIPSSISGYDSYLVYQLAYLQLSQLTSTVRSYIISLYKSSGARVRVDCVVKDPSFSYCSALPSLGSASSKGVAPHGHTMALVAFRPCASLFISDSGKTETDRMPPKPWMSFC